MECLVSCKFILCVDVCYSIILAGKFAFQIEVFQPVDFRRRIGGATILMAR